eukprot:1865742-Pleurochrysis_carterae.AAC.5
MAVTTLSSMGTSNMSIDLTMRIQTASIVSSVLVRNRPPSRDINDSYPSAPPTITARPPPSTPSPRSSTRAQCLPCPVARTQRTCEPGLQIMISRKLWLRLLVGGVAATLLLTLPLLFLQVHHDATLDPQIGRALRSANRARKKTTQPYAKKVEPHDSSRAQDARIVRAPTHRLSDASRQAAASLATAGTDIRSSGRWVANSSKFSSKGTLQYEANQNVLPRAHAISSTARLASAHSEQIKQQRVQPRQRTGHTRTADAVGKTALLPSEVPRVDRPVVESASNVPNTTQVSDGGNKVAEDTGDVDKTLILQNGSATESPTDQIRPGYNVSARELASSTRKWLSYMQVATTFCFPARLVTKSRWRTCASSFKSASLLIVQLPPPSSLPCLSSHPLAFSLTHTFTSTHACASAYACTLPHPFLLCFLSLLLHFHHLLVSLFSSNSSSSSSSS